MSYTTDLKWNHMALCGRRWLEAQTLNLDEYLAGSGLMSERDHLNIEIEICIIPNHYLYVEM